MTDLDLAGFLAVLREGVFGAPPPPPADIAAWFADRLGAGPWRLTAFQTDADLGADRRGRWAWLRIHPGIAYLLWNGASPVPRLRLPARLLASDSQPLATPDDLIKAVQQALLSLRRRELADLARARGPAPGRAAERETRGVLIARLNGGEPWRDAYAVWSGIVLLRHQDQVNSVRRKLIEILALATVDIDRDKELAEPFRAAVETILGTYALTPLIAAAADHLERIAALRDRTGHEIPAVVARAVAWAEAHLHEPISLRHAARAAGVGPEHLARQARLALGRSFLDHLTARRIARAEELLATTDLPVAEIGRRTGFASSEHFHRTFRRRTGTTPGMFRTRSQGG